MKRILSMLLALCMVVTLLPVTAMAEEIHTPIGTSGEITYFAPLTETEKTRALGTSIQDLELPETLAVTVRTAVTPETQDSGNPEAATPTTAAEPEWEETTVDIPVTWTSQPEYDMDAEGEYVFTPVIEGYTVSAELPQIAVRVGEPAFAARGNMLLSIEGTDVANVAKIGEEGYPTLQAAVNDVAEGQTIELVSDITLSAVVTIASGNTTSFTLDLNAHTLNGGSNSAINHEGSGTLTVKDTASGGKVTSNVDQGAIRLDGGSLAINATVENMNSSGLAIDNWGVGDVSVSGGTLSANTGICNRSSGSVSVTGGTVECTSSLSAAISNDGTGDVSVSGGTVQNTAEGVAIFNGSAGKITVSGNAVVTGASTLGTIGTIYLFRGTAADTVLEITGGTIENTAAGNAIYNKESGKIVIPSGSSVIKGGGKAMNTAPDLSAYANVRITASMTVTDGSATSEIAKTDIDTNGEVGSYKYLKFEPSSGVSEQFSLAPGGTYYFDLSGEKGNIGTVNAILPDTTLHYVPFTYAGTVNAYSLTSAMAITQEQANASKSDRSLFVGDYNIGTSISWNSLNTANLIFGKTFDTNYTLRSLSAGSSRTGSAPGGSDHIGQPNTNEWDQILTKSGSTSNTTGWIKNWNSMLSWGQDTSAASESYRAYRGGLVQQWDHISPSSAFPNLGFRPALEVLNPGTLGSDGLKTVTLNLNGGSLKGSTANINIICAGDSFKAPSGEGLTAPVGNTFDRWKDTNSTATYAAGATVPNTVTGLTAQWAAPSVAKIGEEGYSTLQAAVDAVAGGQTIQLVTDITLTALVTIASDKTTSITLDLNGKTLDSGSNVAINHNGSGTLTITDTKGGGMVTSKTTTGTIRANDGSKVNISGGTVSTTGVNGYAIFSANAILNISGGTVSATGSNGEAIYSTNTYAKLNILGGTISAVNGIAIRLQNTTIQGGTTSIIQGGNKAMVFAPTLDSGMQGGASTNYDGSGSVAYSAANIANYKYLKFGLDVISPVLSAGSVSRTSDTAATIGFTTDKAGTAYYLVVNSGASAPTSAAVKAGTSLGSVSETVTGKAVALTAGAKDIYVLVEDSGDNISTPLKIEALAHVAPDTTPPAVTSVSVPGFGTYTTGQTLDFTVSFSEAVTVNTAGGTPYLSLIIGSTSRHATYVSGSGTTTLTFRYTIQSGDSDSNGITIGALNVNGGTLRDSNGNDAVLTLNSVGSTSGILVDTSAAPSITSHPSPQTVNQGQSATFSVTASGTGLTYQWQVNNGIDVINLKGGGIYSGATTATLTIAEVIAEMNGYQYRAVVTDSTGRTCTSNWATLTVNPATYTISGTIKGSDTGSGITSASVWLKSGGANVGSPVLTDTNGAYTISNVSAGTYSIEVGSPGYYTGTISSFTVSASVTGKDLTLTRTVTFTPVTDITMTNASVQVGSDLTLTGIVSPANATNQSIVWSIESANGTGATIVGSTFRATSAGTATVKATITNGSTENSDYTKTFDITVTTAPVVTHTITATTSTGGTISPSGSVTVNSGTSQTFTITPTSNYSIADVKVDGVSQGRITSYTFSNVTANHTISATFSYNGSSSGGGGSSDNNSSVIVTPPAPDKPNSPTQGEIKVSGTVDSKGNITVNITDKTVTDAFEKALADAKKNGNEQNGITVILRVDTGSKTGSNVTVNLPKTVQDTIIAKKIVNTIVVVDNPDIQIGMDLASVQQINKQAKSDVNITATRTDSGKLTEEGKQAIGSRPVFDLKVNYGSGKQVQSFGSGSVSVTIPYTLGSNEKAGNVQAVYVDANGKVHWLTNSVYDSGEKVLRFATSHFSTYGIGYKQADTAFVDIASHWAKEDIEFVVSRGLFGGTSATAFGPNTAMTRGTLSTALGRLANADVRAFTKSSFIDVKNDGYNMGYIEWASKNKIVSGVGNGAFAPEQGVTREQMAVMMQNYAKAIGFTLPKVHEGNTFADGGKISAYATDAVKQMQMAGVISGKNSNLFDPQGMATRAEVSAVLRRFVELAISSNTMQGWARNDSGQWMYYENGKPVTGKKDIGGTTYTFDQYGVTADVPKNLKYATYTVQKGDSFWFIARKLGCTMSELERLNNKSSFDLIHPGDVLRVPGN